MKRMRWDAFIVDDRDVKLPGAFAEILKKQQIDILVCDVLNLSIEQVAEICKYLWGNNEPCFKILGGGLFQTFLTVTQQLAIEGILGMPEEEIFQEVAAGYANFFWTCWVAQLSKKLQERTDYKKELLSFMSQQRIDWGSQYAIFHNIEGGNLTELGKKIFDCTKGTIELLLMVDGTEPTIVKVLSENKNN